MAKTMERDEMVVKILNTIQEETGKSVDEFVNEIKSKKLEKHGKIRDHFKTTYEMKYGYANTLAHVVREEIEGKSSGQELVDTMFEKKPQHLPIYTKIIDAVSSFGKVEISPKKSYVSLRGDKQFALLKPSTKTRFDVGLILKDKDATDRLEEGSSWNAMCTHRVKLSNEDEVDEELISWLQEAYDAAS